MSIYDDVDGCGSILVVLFTLVWSNLFHRRMFIVSTLRGIPHGFHLRLCQQLVKNIRLSEPRYTPVILMIWLDTVQLTANVVSTCAASAGRVRDPRKCLERI